MARKIKVGIIGAGGVAQWGHIPGYQAAPDTEVVAICDIDLGKAKQAAEKFGIPKVFDNHKELLRLEEIDCVSVCTPNAFHMPASVAALKAGKHVLCEKPMAINAQEGEKMVETARKTGKKLMIGLNHRFHPKSQALRRLIEEGKLGELYFAKAVCTRRRGIPGSPTFMHKSLSGGGPLLDLGVHILDLTLWMMGLPKPVSVLGATYCKIGNEKPPARGGSWDYKSFDVEDLGLGLIRFEDGATIFLEASFCANIQEGEFNTYLYGDKGGAQLHPFRIYTEYGGMLADVTPVGLPENVSTHSLEIAAFIEAIRKDKPVPVPGEELLLTTKILDAIYESGETGKEVTISW